MLQSRKKQLIISGVVAALGLIMILTVLVIHFSKDKYYKYENRLAGFSIKYPAQWSLAENRNGAVVIFYTPMQTELDYFQDSVNIVVQDISASGMDIREYTETAINQIRVVFKDSIDITFAEPTRLDGEHAFRIEYLAKGPETEFRYIHVWTMKDYFAYQITYTSLASSYEEYVDKYEKMIKTFKIL